MKKLCRLTVFDHGASTLFGGFVVFIGILVLATAAPLHGEAPASKPGRFGGIYKVASSTDPMFPATRQQEFFLDFGRGIQPGKISGSVAVSMRQNPNVRVRIMAWQYFPDQGKIAIGNPYAEGSRKAVLKGAWTIKSSANGFILERGSYQVVLHRADPKDY